MAQFMQGISDWLSHDAWNGIYALLTIGLLLAAVAAAWYAKSQVQAEHRPYVIVWVEESKAGPQLFDLVVKNIGRRPAINVSLSLDPPPKRAEEVRSHDIAKAKMLTQPISMIAPNQELRLFYDNHIDRIGRNDLPSFHTATYTYEDGRKRWGKKPPYKENSILDLEALKGTLFVSVNTVHDVGKTLKEMQKLFQHAFVLPEHKDTEAATTKEDLKKANALLQKFGYGENYFKTD